jgi:Transposase IS66 family
VTEFVVHGRKLSLPGQSATAKHLLPHEQPHYSLFLRCPGWDATNNFAERAMRLMALIRKT